MPRPSSIATGFRTAVRQPALVAGEIAWRWSFGVAAWGLLLFTFFAYLHSLTISSADWLMLRTKAPPLMAEAVRHILSGSGPRLLRAAAVLLPAFTVMWIAAASVGRWASLRALMETHGRFRTILGLHFLRAAGALAAWIGYLGALLVAGFVASRGPEDQSGLFLLVFFVLSGVVGVIHGRIRWYLFLANLLAARDGSDAFSSVAAAFDIYRQRRGRFLSLAAAMGGIRIGLVIGVTIVSLVPTGMLASSAWKLLVVVLAIITLAYFVISDFLFVARLAAYVDILRDDPEPAPVVAASTEPPMLPEPVLPATHDPGPASDAPMTDDRGPTTPQLEPSS